MATPRATPAYSRLELFREVSNLRGLKILHSVPISVSSSRQMQHLFQGTIDEPRYNSVLQSGEISLHKLHLVPPGFQLRQFTVSLLTEQVAAMYDSKQHRMVVQEKVGALQEQPILAHEFTHALQDQHFNLERLVNSVPVEDGDRLQAVQSLVEGDATLLMQDYLQQHLAQALVLGFSAALGAQQEAVIRNAPPVLVEQLEFPYLSGMQFVAELRRRGGWAAVNRAFQRPPTCTSQILHPDRYWHHIEPRRVTLPDLTSTLGRGWKRLGAAGTDGEWTYGVLVKEVLGPAQAELLAGGWDGDRSVVYQKSPSGKSVLIMLSHWRSAQAATSYRQAMFARIQRTNHTGRSSRWHTPDGDILLEQRGAYLLYADGLPGGSSEVRTVRRIWKALPVH